MKLNPTNTAIIKRLLVGRNSRPLLSILNRVESVDLASLFPSLNPRETKLLIDALISIDKAVEVLLEVPEQRLGSLLDLLESSALLSLLVYASEEDAAYLLSLLDKGQQAELLEQLELPKRQLIQQFLDYPEDSAGRIMQTQVFSVPAHLTAAEGLEVLRTKAQELSIYYIYCINEDHQLVGVVSLRILATAPATTPLEQIMKREVVAIKPTTPAEEVASLVAHYDFVALPVIDDSHHLVGIVTVDDVLDIIQEKATANMYAQAGLQQDDRVFSTAKESIRHRLPWMGLNLLMASVASSVVSFFEDTISQLIILATLQNIVAGVGGNTAIQTLTVVTRGLATGDFNFITYARAILKEVTVGLVNGLVVGLAAGVLTFLWRGNILVSIVICMALLLNSLVAAFFGALIPITLKKFKWDPAVGSGVLITMITDIFGFFSFLGIATLGLKMTGQL